MDSVWKIIVAPLLVAVIGGTLVAIIIGRIQAPEEAAVSAQLQWLDVPNPVYGTDGDAQQRRLKALHEGYPKGTFIKLLEENRFKPMIRILRMKFENNSEVRSKEIEIAGSHDALFVSPQSKDEFGQAASTLLLKPIGPKETAEVWGVSEEWFDFEDNPIKALHDNRLMAVSIETVRSDPAGIARFVNENPFLAFFIMLAGSVCGLFILFAIVVGTISQFSMEFKSKITTKDEAAKMQKFLDYLRTHHPEKLA